MDVSLTWDCASRMACSVMCDQDGLHLDRSLPAEDGKRFSPIELPIRHLFAVAGEAIALLEYPVALLRQQCIGGHVLIARNDQLDSVESGVDANLTGAFAAHEPVGNSFALYVNGSLRIRHSWPR